MLNIPTYVIYHSADFDGLFCREIARRGLPRATLIGWNYGDPVPVIPEGARLYLLDLSIHELMRHPDLVWIDHHGSAIDEFSPKIEGYRIDGVAACRLAWQWFHRQKHCALPTKSQYVERTVREPYPVQLAGEYDVWDKRNPDAEVFQYGLQGTKLTDHMWNHMFDNQSVEMILRAGEAVRHVKDQENRDCILREGFSIQFEGLTLLACNHPFSGSHLFTAGLTQEHDACMRFHYNGHTWKYSLYHAPGKEHHDLTRIAKKYGGGGHRGACGFVSPTPII